MLEIETRQANETLERTIAYLLEQIDALKLEKQELQDRAEAEKRNSIYWWNLYQETQKGAQECLKTE